MPQISDGALETMRAVRKEDLSHPSLLVGPLLLGLLADGPAHGYELMGRLKPFGYEWESPTTIYRHLRLFESEGLVTSSWSTVGSGPAIRVYELTSCGCEALDRFCTEIEQLTVLLNKFLGRRPASTARDRPPERPHRAGD